MKSAARNNAYIDGANLHKGSAQLLWQLDYRKLRVWLSDKYGVEHAYLFLGLVPKYKNLYTYLQECGFTLVFKEVTYDGTGKVKGNGDYTSLVSFLLEKNKLTSILSPAVAKKCSILLKRTGARIAYINDQKTVLEVTAEPEIKKAPDEDKTS